MDSATRNNVKVLAAVIGGSALIALGAVSAIVLHEASMTGGLGGEIAARITERAFEYLDGPVLRMAAPDTPVPFSPPLEEAFLPNATGIVEKARWLYSY